MRSESARACLYAHCGVLAVLVLLYLVTFFLLGGVGGALFFLLPMLWPLAVNLRFATRFQTLAGQSLLIFTTLAYAGFGVWVYLYAAVWNPDSQGALAFFFMSIYALPGLAVLWLLAALCERVTLRRMAGDPRHDRRAAPDG